MVRDTIQDLSVSTYPVRETGVVRVLPSLLLSLYLLIDLMSHYHRCNVHIFLTIPLVVSFLTRSETGSLCLFYRPVLSVGYALGDIEFSGTFR